MAPDDADSARRFGRIVGRSRALRQVLAQVDDVAATDATVLITGESGTGKELLAREIHERSRRAQRPFVRVNCSAIPREMFESEFFGHVRGAFTGAVRDRSGRFQTAHGGTIFLDEVGDLPIDLQPKLLRVLQEGEYERVGEDVTRTVDVRVIAATNRDLAEERRAQRFREDLFYRLHVFPLELPPLRARQGDIAPLAQHAIRQVSLRLRLEAPVLTAEDVSRLQHYDWPGNIRELQNVIERAVILSKGGRLRLDIALPDAAATRLFPPRGSAGADEDEAIDDGLGDGDGDGAGDGDGDGGRGGVGRRASGAHAAADVILTEREWRESQRQNLLRALARTNGRIYGKDGAAALLGLNPTTLASRLRVLKIVVPK